MHVSFVDALSAPSGNRWYPSNRPPLVRNSLSPLPVGAVKPRGWLRHQLELMADGMTGHLMELSDFLAEDNGWLTGEGEGWEEQAYWLRGFYNLGVLLDDERILSEAQRWIEAVIASQDADGYFGSKYHRAHEVPGGPDVPDLWPHMVMLDALISHYEHTGDERVPRLMSEFFAFCRDLDDEQFLPPLDSGETHWKLHVQHKRAGDMIPHIHRLYNMTGERWLLDVATRFFRHITPPISEWLDDHVVHFTQRFSYPGIYSAQTGEDWLLRQSEFWYRQHMATWGQQPRGIFGADERVRPGRVDPRQAIETCAMAEFAKSFALLGRITGDTLWADRTEDVILNHFPAASDPWLKGLHYLTASNQPQLDASAEHDYYNRGRQIDYSPHIYRCCQHNVAQGWPRHCRDLWQATCDNGLAAWLYGASTATARVGEAGELIVIREDTDYPFSGHVALTIESEHRIAFPLYLRKPRWCEGMLLSINGTEIDLPDEPRGYLRIERMWQAGDRVEIDFAMALDVTQWPRNGAVTVDRGPLSYSVRIDERWEQFGDNDEWPEWEVFPESPWNYALVLGRDHPERHLRVTENGEVPEQPWTVEAAPISIEATARRVRDWQIGEDETVQEVPKPPIEAAEEDETITLIPLGCARLRMSVLPVVDE